MLLAKNLQHFVHFLLFYKKHLSISLYRCVHEWIQKSKVWTATVKVVLSVKIRKPKAEVIMKEAFHMQFCTRFQLRSALRSIFAIGAKTGFILFQSRSGQLDAMFGSPAPSSPLAACLQRSPPAQHYLLQAVQQHRPSLFYSILPALAILKSWDFFFQTYLLFWSVAVKCRSSFVPKFSTKHW